MAEREGGEMMGESLQRFLICLAMLLSFLGVIGCDISKKAKACAEAGGIYISSTASGKCFDKSAIITPKD